MLVELRDVRKAYRNAAEEVQVLRGVDLALPAGSMTSLVGASGSGKSTLIALLAGLLLADEGQIRFDGDDLAALDERGRARLRARRIGVALQSSNLVPFLTAEENVRLAQDLAAQPAAVPARVLLERLGVGHRRRHRLSRLSGGEAQRVALAVALANRPDLLLADEVVGAVDAATAEQVMAVVRRTWREDGTAVLFVTHNPTLAREAQQQLRLERGRVVAA
jgi:putative ABC transport system ATP-binding protein